MAPKQIIFMSIAISMHVMFCILTTSYSCILATFISSLCFGAVDKFFFCPSALKCMEPYGEITPPMTRVYTECSSFNIRRIISMATVIIITCIVIDMYLDQNSPSVCRQLVHLVHPIDQHIQTSSSLYHHTTPYDQPGDSDQLSPLTLDLQSDMQHQILHVV